MNYEFKAYQQADLTKLDIRINGEKIEALFTGGGTKSEGIYPGAEEN